jgi:hypothetical protein
MEREIYNQKLRMATVLVVALAIAVWQQHFIITAIKANIYLNVMIFGAFALAAVLAYRTITTLKDDVLALNALRADFGSNRLAREDVYKQKAKTFNEPALIGHAYSLIAEELANREKLVLSTDTVHTLLASVDARINERKSMILYFSGLMVFLGLFGTFVGLMETVDSVGAIISGLDFSGGKSADDAFGNLIEGLKGPLNGMATGFGSSLFGLTTSLLLGLQERFSTAASRAVRQEFEGWLTNLSSLSEKHEEDSSPEVSSFGLQRALAEAKQSIAHIEKHNRETAILLGETTRSVTDVATSVTALTQVVASFVAEREKATIADASETRMLLEQQRMMTGHAADFMTAIADERLNAMTQMSDIREVLQVLVERTSEGTSQHIDQGAWAIPDDTELAEMAQAQTPGARNLLSKLYGRFQKQSTPAAISNVSMAIPVARAIEKLVAQQKRFEETMVSVDSRRGVENSLTRRALRQQEELLAQLGFLLSKSLAGHDATKSDPMNVEIESRLQEQRVAFDIALKRLEMQIQHIPSGKRQTASISDNDVPFAHAVNQ